MQRGSSTSTRFVFPEGGFRASWPLSIRPTSTLGPVRFWEPTTRSRPTTALTPCCCAGGIGAARNIESLRKAGIRYIVNASPVVPRFHPNEMTYKVVQVFDDPEEDIAQHFDDVNQFIQQVCTCGTALCVFLHAPGAAMARLP